MKHWQIAQVAWNRFDPARLDAGLIPLVKAAAMVEKNGVDYALYLNRVFQDDPDFRRAADNWAVEEVQHGDALGRWAMLADPGWSFDDAFERYRNGYRIDVNADASIRGSRTGELIARCMVETGTSSYYTALGEATEEPVLKEICRLIAADEYRHFKLFYDHMKRYLARERLSFPQRLRVAAGRIGESEDDELAYAYHCGNEPEGAAYDHERCIAGYMGRAMGYYRYRHIERGMGMVFKSIGLTPRGRLAGLAAQGAWRLLRWRHGRYQQWLARSDATKGKLAARSPAAA
ncbi:ferritin-like domain-containing protein [Teichococcus aestuarii]|uniref:ferritin-like domain-containing protein n=1 Tax=Teichococcus aestuarii TaxID=568898 RepID=UPI003605F458